MKRDRLLWVDDEISLLRPHILFLEGKGYEVDTVTNGQDALDRCRATTYDLIFLDENMPGLSGLQTLALIKEICPTVPVVMITKSEEENIMDMAIGQKIADYLIKLVTVSLAKDNTIFRVVLFRRQIFFSLSFFFLCRQVQQRFIQCIAF